MKRNEIWTLMFLQGSKFTEIAKAHGVGAPAVRQAVLTVLKAKNPILFKSGIQHGSSNNYQSPPARWLREEFAFMLRDTHEPVEIYEWL